jgi:4-hydroxy-4-methyl-2-oxoglutarate aldolase
MPIEQTGGASSLGEARVALISDALDRLGLRAQALDPAIGRLHPGRVVVGRALPILVRASDRVAEEPYASEMHAIESLRPGDVPVYAVAPGVRAALWGELFACAARGRGAAGVVVDGYVRDVRQLRELGFPVFCRGHSPLDTQGRAEVAAIGEPVTCGGVPVEAGDYVVGDEDGVVIVPGSALESVLGAIGQKDRDEQGALADLVAGVGIRDVWEKWGVL